MIQIKHTQICTLAWVKTSHTLAHRNKYAQICTGDERPFDQLKSVGQEKNQLLPININILGGTPSLGQTGPPSLGQTGTRPWDKPAVFCLLPQ